jgi:uncharacterized membrane protein
MPSARKIPLLAFYVALVTVSTIIFTVYVPATRGYFNIGEAAIYVVALLSGRYFGAVAGGMGSALADLLLGYYIFAPATLVVKGLEGGLLGYLAEKRPELSKGKWVVLSLIIGIGLFLSVFLIGSTYYTGAIELNIFGLWPVALEVSPLFWGLIATASAALVVSAGLLSGPEVGWLILSAMASGMIMVTGYFLYEQLILGLAAIVEVPFNLGQVTVGVLLAVPSYKSLKVLRQRTK